MAKQLPVRTRTGRRRRNIVYVPPPPEAVEVYSRAVCEQLGKKLDASYNTPETIRELSAFIQLVSSICAKHLNRS